MRERETVVYNLTQVILVNNAGRMEEYLSTQERLPARIAKNNFFFQLCQDVEVLNLLM